MRLLAKGASRAEEPSADALDRALAEYFERHRDEYVQPQHVSLVHVFLRGDAKREPEARELRARLVATSASPAQAAKEGDPFVAGSLLRATTHAGLVKVFGEELTTVVAALAPGQWSEPIRSPYGLHLVWVLDRSDARVPPLDEVRSQVLYAWRAERQRAYLEKMLAGIRAAYEVKVEGEGIDDD
jgi:hypothetical protein